MQLPNLGDDPSVEEEFDKYKKRTAVTVAWRGNAQEKAARREQMLQRRRCETLKFLRLNEF